MISRGQDADKRGFLEHKNYLKFCTLRETYSRLRYFWVVEDVIVMWLSSFLLILLALGVKRWNDKILWNCIRKKKKKHESVEEIPENLSDIRMLFKKQYIYEEYIYIYIYITYIYIYYILYILYNIYIYYIYNHVYINYALYTYICI